MIYTSMIATMSNIQYNKLDKNVPVVFQFNRM